MSTVRLPVVDGDENADIYGYAASEGEAFLVADTAFADRVVRVERYGPIRLQGGRTLPEAYVAITEGCGELWGRVMNTSPERAAVTPDILLFVAPQTLSDGSVAYDVKLGNLTLHAISEEEAHEMAEQIADAINDHSVNVADVVSE